MPNWPLVPESVLGSVQDVPDVFARLVESVSPLFSAEIVGFLLYDEEKHTLEARIPFADCRHIFAEIYRTEVPPNSAAEQVIASQQSIVTLSAVIDENWRTLGLSNIATAASLRDIAYSINIFGTHAGLFTGGTSHRRYSPFNVDEIRLMNIVANQAAAIIENILLVQQARARAQRSDALRRIASLSGSSATLEEDPKIQCRN